MLTDAELYARGTHTLIASWKAYALGSRGAQVHLLPGVAAAVFPNEPERDIYNNALLERDLSDVARMAALDMLEAAYASAGVTRFAVWAHETDLSSRVDLERNAYRLDTTTRAMGTALDGLHLPSPSTGLGSATWQEYLRAEQLPPTFLAGADHAAFHPLVARVGDEIVATCLAYDRGSDCGIYNVSTQEAFRRRGLGTALTAAQLHHARARGMRTASLQASAMAEGLYTAVGFRDLGRILEYTPTDLRDVQTDEPHGSRRSAEPGQPQNWSERVVGEHQPSKTSNSAGTPHSLSTSSALGVSVRVLGSHRAGASRWLGRQMRNKSPSDRVIC